MDRAEHGDDPYAHVAHRFVAHYATLRGAVRHTLVTEQLDRHLPDPPCAVLDLGGGAGHQAVRLARAGYAVSLLDPSERMLEEARARLGTEPRDVRKRVRLIHACAQDAVDALAGERFGAVCCHAVLPYVESPPEVLDPMVALAAPGALLSVLFKNADALPFRAALEQRWEDALDAFDADRDVGGLGVTTRADRLADVVGALEERGAEIERWYGIRIFSDHLHDASIEDLPRMLPVESTAGGRDPYRALGRLIHVIARSHT